MSIATVLKDPAAILDYSLDWGTSWLGTDTIASSTWTVPSGITKVTSSNTTTTTLVRLSGGTDGSDYECVNQITTAGGQVEEKSLLVLVRQAEITSGDAVDWTSALAELLEKVQIAVAPTLTMPEIETILNRNKRAVTRANSTAYTVNQIMMPSPRNGHRYRCTVSGISATADPFLNYRWPLVQGTRVSEGTSTPTLTWVEDGPEYANIYDVRQAAYECWLLRANKASQFIQTGDLKIDQMYQHAMAQAGRFGSLGIG